MKKIIAGFICLLGASAFGTEYYPAYKPYTCSWTTKATPNQKLAVDVSVSPYYANVVEDTNSYINPNSNIDVNWRTQSASILSGDYLVILSINRENPKTNNNCGVDDMQFTLGPAMYSDNPGLQGTYKFQIDSCQLLGYKPVPSVNVTVNKDDGTQFTATCGIAKR